jgi:hypothetical protein
VRDEIRDENEIKQHGSRKERGENGSCDCDQKAKTIIIASLTSQTYTTPTSQLNNLAEQNRFVFVA